VRNYKQGDQPDAIIHMRKEKEINKDNGRRYMSQSNKRKSIIRINTVIVAKYIWPYFSVSMVVLWNSCILISLNLH
jgi:hypothetical protein